MAASDGTLVYLDLGGAGGAQWQLVWIDRQGTKIGAIGEPHGTLNSPALSPDGRLVAVTADRRYLGLRHRARNKDPVEQVRREVDMRSRFGRLTETYVAFTSNRAGTEDGQEIVSRKADGSGEVEVLAASPKWLGRLVPGRQAPALSHRRRWRWRSLVSGTQRGYRRSGSHTRSCRRRRSERPRQGSHRTAGLSPTFRHESGRPEVNVQPFVDGRRA